VSLGRSSIFKSGKNIVQIKESLMKRKQELEEQLAQLHEDQSPRDLSGHDAGDQAISSIIENLRNSLQDTELGEYKRIVRALKMIEDGTYGVCLDCSKDISEKRLKSYPNATISVVCQEALEESAIK